MSACSDFVEHIWKPGSCKNCFCLRSDHQLTAGHPKARASSLPAGARLPARPEICRLEDEGVNGLAYSKPTIAVKPTMMTSETADLWTEASLSTEVPKVNWRRTPGKLLLQKQEDGPIVYLGSFRGMQKATGPLACTDSNSRCPPAYTMVGLHNLEARVDRNTALQPVNFQEEKAGREELPSAQESFRQKLAAFTGMTSSCPKGPRPCTSPQPLRESLPSEDDSDQRCSPSGDSEGGEYCSILDCRPESRDAVHNTEGSGRRRGDCSPICWEQGTCTRPTEEEKQALNFPRECCGQGSTANPPHLGPKKPSLNSEAASSSDGLSCGSSRSGANSPFAPHLENDYCSLVKEPTSVKQQDSGCHLVNSGKYVGQAVDLQPPALPREAVQPEPIYAESAKRKKAAPVPQRPQPKKEQVSSGQVWTGDTWSQKTPSGWSQEREGPNAAPQVATTITVIAAHPEEDHRTIYLSSPDSAVGVQWPRGSLNQDLHGSGEEPLVVQGLSSRESHPHNMTENSSKEKPAIPPKLSKSSPGGSPVSPAAPPLTDHSDGNTSGSSVGSQPSSRVPTNLTSSCQTNGVAAGDPAKCPPQANSSVLDQRRPRYQTGAWSRQCRIEEEEEVGQELLSQSWGRELENGIADHSNSSTWHRLHPIDGASGQNGKTNSGMSKSASFAFEFPKDRGRLESFSPPPPPPKSR